MTALNDYGDSRNPTKSNFGVDIASQRADDLDNMAIERVRSLAASHPRALDAASAAGGQALRLAQAGAVTVALDLDDYEGPFLFEAARLGVAERCSFLQRDLQTFAIHEELDPFDVVVCQRMIHYVPYSAALAIVCKFRSALTPDGRLFISASGLHSELGNDYPGAATPRANRYFPLSAAMSEKHAIHGPVCLYTVADMANLLEKAGFKVDQVFASAFGNIKAVARL